MRTRYKSFGERLKITVPVLSAIFVCLFKLSLTGTTTIVAAVTASPLPSETFSVIIGVWALTKADVKSNAKQRRRRFIGAKNNTCYFNIPFI
jgi:hypothetical protein